MNIFITGGAQGIGKAITRKFLKEKWLVTILDNDKEAIDELVGEYPELITVHGDVSNPEDVETATKKAAVDEKLDILVNNAGLSFFKPFDEFTLEEWNRVLSVNLTGSWLCAKYCAKYLKPANGCIVNMASTRAFMSEPGSEAYAASKGGLIALTHALAVSLGPDVRVNSISPGWVDVTSLQKSANRKQIDWDECHHKQHPAGRIGKGEDIAEAVWYLGRKESGFITGQNMTIDGGMTIKMIYGE